jgi:hypothetical protein
MARRSSPGQYELILEHGGRQTLDCVGHLRLLFMGGRAIQAVTPEPRAEWIAYVGVQILAGREGAVDGGARAASEDRSSTR